MKSEKRRCGTSSLLGRVRGKRLLPDGTVVIIKPDGAQAREGITLKKGKETCGN